MSKTLKDVSEAIRRIDYTMLSTHAADGSIAARPMSNNGDVEYDGDNYFFAFDRSHMIQDIQRDPRIGLAFVGSKGLLGKPLFVAVEAQAELIRDKSTFAAHWNDDIGDWAEQGVDTPGLVLIKAHAVRIAYWEGNDEHDVVL